PDHDCGAERSPARVVLQPDQAGPGQDRKGLDRFFEEDALEPDPPSGPRRERADGAAALPRPAQRTVQAVPGDHEPHGEPVAPRALRPGAPQLRSPRLVMFGWGAATPRRLFEPLPRRVEASNACAPNDRRRRATGGRVPDIRDRL